MIFYPFRRATLLVPSGPAHDPERKHLFIILTDRCPEEDTVLMVDVCRIKDAYHDSTCTLNVGDHEFIRQPSFVNYRRARIEAANALIIGVERQVMVPKGTIAEDIFARICYGLLQSRHCAPKFQNYLKRRSGVR